MAQGQGHIIDATVRLDGVTVKDLDMGNGSLISLTYLFVDVMMKSEVTLMVKSD